MTKPFTGTTEECLKHFVGAHEINTMEEKEYKRRNAISHLLGINQATGYEWFSNFRMPKGENLLRLRYFLELNGYQLLERQGMPELIREFSEQIALGAMSLAEAAEYIGTTSDVILDVVMRRQGVSSQRETQVKELVELHQNKATERLREWQATMKSLGFAQPTTKTVAASLPQLSQLNDGQVIETLAHLVLATRPLAERVLSDDFSADDRRRLRELTANGRSNAVFDLSNLLNRLCGERARKEIS